MTSEQDQVFGANPKIRRERKIVLLSCFDNDQEENTFTAHI